jgi:large subunit ribosomal protein L18
MGDITLASAHSKELEKIGWRGDTSNTPTAYLIGLLCGYRALKAGINECILDIGMHDPAPKARVFAVTKGALDAGLYIPLDKGVLPDDRRVRGEHIADYAAELKKEREEIYRIRFSAYLRKGLQPELLPSHFDKIRSRIIQSHR